jgi:DNA-3-methyladenine glycosylase
MYVIISLEKSRMKKWSLGYNLAMGFNSSNLKTIPRKFFLRDASIVAPDLLGKYLVRNLGQDLVIGKIVEVEAYLPFVDPAAHSYKGKTKRTESLFGMPGFSYVYSIHGKHCLDVVTNDVDIPGSVLIRALEPMIGIETMKRLRSKSDIKDLTSGPGKLCQAMAITRELNNIDLLQKDSVLKIAALSGKDEIANIAKSTRIGKVYHRLLSWSSGSSLKITSLYQKRAD